MSRLTVPGEGVPLPISVSLTAAGFAAALVAAPAWFERTPSREPAVADPPRPHSAAPDASAPASVPPDAAPIACPPLVFTFATDSAVPSPLAAEPTARHARWLDAHPDAMVVIDGHADSAGDDHTNLELSRRRANAVAAMLVREGVLRARLSVRAFGAFAPLEGEPEGTAANRRVVVRVRGTTDCPIEREEVIGP